MKRMKHSVADKRAEYDEMRKYGQHGQPFQGPPGWQGRSSGGFEDTGDFSDFFSSIFGSRGNGFGGQRPQCGPSWAGCRKMELPIFSRNPVGRVQTDQFPDRWRQHPERENPAGVTDGERIRLKGQGGPGAGGGANGDLYLIIRFAPHPKFDVEGHDLVITVPLAPWEAALGTKVAVPTLTGTLNLTIRADSQSGQRLRIKGHGLADKKGQRGDLYAQLKVVMPKHTDEATKALWQALADVALIRGGSME